MEMKQILRESFEKKSKEELVENCVEYISRIGVFDDFLTADDVTQQFIDYIKDEIKFYKKNNNEFFDKHSLELKKQMIREYEANLKDY